MSRYVVGATDERTARALGSRSQVRANEAGSDEAHSPPIEPECMAAGEPSTAEPFVFTAAGVLALEAQLLASLRSYLQQWSQPGENLELPTPHLLEMERTLQRAVHRAFVQERLQAPGDLHAQNLEEIFKLRVRVEDMSQRLHDREHEIVRLRGLAGATPQVPERTPEAADGPEAWPEAGPEKSAALARLFQDNLKLRAQFAQAT